MRPVRGGVPGHHRRRPASLAALPRFLGQSSRGARVELARRQGYREIVEALRRERFGEVQCNNWRDAEAVHETWTDVELAAGHWKLAVAFWDELGDRVGYLQAEVAVGTKAE